MTGNSYRGLLALVACLKGTPPGEVDWDEVIADANRSLTISSLAAAMSLAGAVDIPEDVRSYFSLIYERNAERNSRLSAQLTEAIGCLNGVGVEPIMMKGAALLLGWEHRAVGARLLTDLDILVRPEEIPDAIAALRRIGYEIQFAAGSGSWPGNPRYHLPAVLARSRDAGAIDLQCRPRGPASFSDVEWLYGRSRRADLDGIHVHIPSPFVQVVFLILHDQFQDGDYWRGLLDLRHLLDMAQLARSAKIDWDELRSLFAAGYERNAVDTQIITADALFGLEGAGGLFFGKLAHCQLARRRLQFGRDYLAVPLTVLTLLTEIFHYPSWDRFGGERYPSRSQEIRRKLRELRRIFRPKPPGKL
ncbi:hypothetical protein ABIE78_002928 [Sinorhizobium fredii]|uniref:Nucleotidyltransferase family protein n=1 Tax=Sinorhizobium fredii (strain USDA 257) TaxID=1185652 RepID=I3X5V7_SINF2|nr:nucleotidyltransferase family protein [Sinorhizobium fredii]AFL51263.1 hypothetical protein USDA257_c26890 [Sinorhizobium fredii USDA 257]